MNDSDVETLMTVLGFITQVHWLPRKPSKGCWSTKDAEHCADVLSGIIKRELKAREKNKNDRGAK